MADSGEKKKEGSFWSSLPEAIKAIAAVITAIGGLAGLILALNQIGALNALKPQATPTPTAVPKYGWEIDFEEDIPKSIWKLGQNSYQIIATCAHTIEGVEDVNSRIGFTVDPNARLFPNDVVELRFFGIPSPNRGEPRLTSINPDQRTRIVLGYNNISVEQAAQVANECQVKAVINDSSTLQISPMGPRPQQ